MSEIRPIEQRLRTLADSSVDERGVALAVIASPELIREAVAKIERLARALKKAKPIVGAACAAAGATNSNDVRKAREKVYQQVCEALELP